MKYYDPGIIVSLVLLLLSVWFISTQSLALVLYGSDGHSMLINGMFSLEMPENAGRVHQIVQHWKSKNVLDTARLINAVDYLVALAYTLFFYFGVQKLNDRFPAVFGDIKPLLLFAALLPGIIDWTGNSVIFFWLNESIDQVTPVLLTAMAAIKIGVGVAMAFLVVGGMVLFFFKYLLRIYRHFV